MEFSVRTEQPILILFLAYSPFDNVFRLEYVLFYQVYAKITTFFYQEMFGGWLLSYTLTSKRLVETDVKMMSRRQKWHQNVKSVILTLCTRVVLHPSCKTTFPSPGRARGNSVRVCKKQFSCIPDRNFHVTHECKAMSPYTEAVRRLSCMTVGCLLDVIFRRQSFRYICRSPKCPTALNVRIFKVCLKQCGKGR